MKNVTNEIIAIIKNEIIDYHKNIWWCAICDKQIENACIFMYKKLTKNYTNNQYHYIFKNFILKYVNSQLNKRVSTYVCLC